MTFTREEIPCSTCAADWAVNNDQCPQCEQLMKEFSEWLYKRDMRRMAWVEAQLRTKRYEKAKMERRMWS